MAIPDSASTPRSTRGPVRRPNQPATQDKTVNHSRLPTSRESEAAANAAAHDAIVGLSPGADSERGPQGPSRAAVSTG
jgi:hypothetical protein